MQNKLAIFDLDGTLYCGNSTFDFINFVMKDDKKYLSFKKNYKIMRIYNKFANYFFGYDWYKIKSVNFLKGFKKQELIEKSEEFFENILKENEIKDLFQLLELYKKEGYELCILTATLNVIAIEIGKNLKIDKIYSTNLIYDNNVCTGKYEVDLLNNKLELFNNEIRGKYDKVLFFSDNKQDIQLLRAVTTGFRVYIND